MKKNIAIGLILTICLSNVSMISASEKTNMRANETTRDIIEEYNDEQKEIILNEIDIIDRYFFNKEHLMEIDYQNEGIVYSYTTTLESGEIVKSEIEYTRLDNGASKFDVVEGDLHNELVYISEDEILVDGMAVEVEIMENNDFYKSFGIAEARAMGTVSYSTSPFWGNARDYTLYQGKSKYNLIFDKSIQTIAVSVIISVIGNMVPGIGTAIGATLMATNIRDAFKNLNLTGKTLYYTSESWDNPKAPSFEATLISYTKITQKWFTDSRYSDEITSSRETYYTKTKLRDV